MKVKVFLAALVSSLLALKSLVEIHEFVATQCIFLMILKLDSWALELMYRNTNRSNAHYPTTS